MRNLFIIVIAFLFIGCDFNQKIKENINNQVNENVDAIENTLNKSRADIQNSFEKIISQNQTDTAKVRKANILYNSFTDCGYFHKFFTQSFTRNE